MSKPDINKLINDLIVNTKNNTIKWYQTSATEYTAIYKECLLKADNVNLHIEKPVRFFNVIKNIHVASISLDYWTSGDCIELLAVIRQSHNDRSNNTLNALIGE